MCNCNKISHKKLEKQKGLGRVPNRGRPDFNPVTKPLPAPPKAPAPILEPSRPRLPDTPRPSIFKPTRPAPKPKPKPNPNMKVHKQLNGWTVGNNTKLFDKGSGTVGFQLLDQWYTIVKEFKADPNRRLDITFRMILGVGNMQFKLQKKVNGKLQNIGDPIPIRNSGKHSMSVRTDATTVFAVFQKVDDGIVTSGRFKDFTFSQTELITDPEPKPIEVPKPKPKPKPAPKPKPKPKPAPKPKPKPKPKPEEPVKDQGVFDGVGVKTASLISGISNKTLMIGGSTLIAGIVLYPMFTDSKKKQKKR